MRRFFQMVSFIFLSHLLYCQNSEIKIDSSNKNKVTIRQMGDSAQKSNVGIQHADSNDVIVNQTSKDSTSYVKSEDTSLIRGIKNSYLVITLCIAIGVLIITWRKVLGTRKQNKKEKMNE